MPIKIVDLEKFEEGAANIYEAVSVVAKRSRTINDERKMELAQRLEPIMTKENEDETIMNQDKLNLSLEFEKREKPTIEAVNEMLNKELAFRLKNEE